MEREDLNIRPRETNLTGLSSPFRGDLHECTGVQLLQNPLYNKGLAFDLHERDRFGLRGLLPPVVQTIEEQVQRNMEIIRSCENDFLRNQHLCALQNRNETLFHRLLVEHIEEVVPWVYTPTVGQTCENFGHYFTSSRSTIGHRMVLDFIFQTITLNLDVHIIVVTDGSRILGLGDLGAHGMGIPIGKLGLYCAAGGISPEKVLPIFVDVGTNNESLLQDGNYLGVRSNRLEGDQYFHLFDEFMFAVCNRWPHAFVQFEDIESSKAEIMLERYSSKYRCFNDDIQGTGCVTLAGLITACRISGTILTNMKILCVGAGSAGIGVCSMIAEGMIQNGMDRRNAMKNFVICTSKGALGREDDLYGNPNTKRGIKEDHLPWVNPEIIDGTPIEKVMEEFQPTVLLGLSKQQGLFTEQLIRQMSNQCHQIGIRPIVMPMSNPLSKSECTAEEAYQWTNGEVIVASGSPFPPVTISNGKTYKTSQCNNMFIFPGIGLAASVGGIKKITTKMLYQAAVACSEAVTSEEEKKGQIFPGLDRIRQVSHSVATVIIDEAIKANLAPNLGEREINGISELVVRSMHFPRYLPLVSKR